MVEVELTGHAEGVGRTGGGGHVDISGALQRASMLMGGRGGGGGEGGTGNTSILPLQNI